MVWALQTVQIPHSCRTSVAGAAQAHGQGGSASPRAYPTCTLRPVQTRTGCPVSGRAGPGLAHVPYASGAPALWLRTRAIASISPTPDTHGRGLVPYPPPPNPQGQTSGRGRSRTHPPHNQAQHGHGHQHKHHPRMVALLLEPGHFVGEADVLKFLVKPERRPGLTVAGGLFWAQHSSRVVVPLKVRRVQQRKKGLARGKGKGKVLGRSPNSSVSVIPTCPKAQHPTAHYISHQYSCNSGTVNSRDT